VSAGVPTGQALIVIIVIRRSRRVHHTRNRLPVWQSIIPLELFLPTPITVAALAVLPSLYNCTNRWLLLIEPKRVSKGLLSVFHDWVDVTTGDHQSICWHLHLIHHCWISDLRLGLHRIDRQLLLENLFFLVSTDLETQDLLVVYLVSRCFEETLARPCALLPVVHRVFDGAKLLCLMNPSSDLAENI
jgi:hypothetical protein